MSTIVSILKILIEFPYEYVESILHTEKNKLHGVQLSGRKILGISEKLDLQLFKDIATARKCSVNDVVASCIVGAFRKEDPNATSITVIIPVGGLMPGSYGTQNTTIVGKFEVDFRNGESHLDLLKRVSRKLEQLKRSSINLGILSVAFITSNHLPSFFEQLTEAPATLLLSTLIGPQFEITINGHKATDVVFFPLNLYNTGKNFWIHL